MVEKYERISNLLEDRDMTQKQVSCKITISEESMTADEKNLLDNYRSLPENEKAKLVEISGILK